METAKIHIIVSERQCTENHIAQKPDRHRFDIAELRSTRDVTLGKLLYHSEPQCPQLRKWRL